jgi:hypothetical protein
MDEDTKTLIAILALVYGSSNGIGLLKSSLDPVAANITALKLALENPLASEDFWRASRTKLRKSLLSFRVLVYVLLVVLVPAFLVLVVATGAHNALHFLGLGVAASAPAVGATPSPGAPNRPSLFYWIMLLLAVISSLHLLSDYIKGWRASFKKKQTAA